MSDNHVNAPRRILHELDEATARVLRLEVENERAQATIRRLAESTTALLQRAEDAEQQVITLTEALRRLMKESAAVIALAEPVLRDVIGHTNVAVFKQRIEEAAILVAVRGER